MKTKFKLLITLVTALFFFSACDNATTTSDATDSSTVHTTDMDTVNKMQDMNMNNGLMGAMNSMMDKMHNMKMAGDFDVDFANMMIEHHQGALDMAQVELSQGKDEKMKSKAQEIIAKQKEEQQQLRDFVSTYKSSGMKHGEGELGKSISATMDKMKSMQMSGDVDKDFSTMMIQHHQDGVAMAKLQLKHGMSEKLKQMAQKVIKDQQKEISEFKSWLTANK